MPLAFTPYVLPLLAAVIAGGAMAIYCWRNRRASGSRSFALLALVIAAWSLAAAMSLLSTQTEDKLFWNAWVFAAMLSSCSIWVAFAVRYGRPGSCLSSWHWAALASLPLEGLVLALSNDSHHLVWTSISVHGTQLSAQYGPGYWLNIGVSCVLGASATAIFSSRLATARTLRIRTVLVLLLAQPLTGGANALQVFGYIGGVDLMPFALCISLAAMYWGFVRERFVDVVPAARGAIFERMSDGILVLDQLGRIVDLNPVAATILGGTRRALLGQFLPLEGELPRELSTIDRHFDVQVAPFDATRGEPGRLLVFRDITARKHAEEARRVSEERFRAQYMSNPIATFSWRRLDDADDFELVDYNEAAAAYLGPHYRTALRATVVMGTLPELLALLRRTWTEQTTLSIELSVDSPLMGAVEIRTTFTYIAPDMILAHSEDITERNKIHRQLQHQARHDALTSLPNRLLLNERLEQAIAHADADGSQVALLLLDLDRFKDVNDSLGHGSGDALLQAISRRLADLAREVEGITIARVGGDEFAVLLPAMDSARALAFATQLRKKLEADVVLDQQAISPEASIGAALYPEHAADADELMRRADMAMYAAKSSGAGCLLYSSEYDRRDPERLALTGELRATLENDGLVLHFQPKLDLATGRIIGAEALVRWPHPRRGLIPPDQFIPLAEQTGLIRELGQWVLGSAIRQVRDWLAKGLLLPVSVNMSMRDLHDPQLPRRVAELLRTEDVPAEWLCVEITESSLMTDPERALGVLTELREMGVRISVDDFGTGYSSLGYLKRLPVDELKIDRSFVHDMATNDSDLVIVRSTVDLAHNLGLIVVAEGVENGITSALLADLTCDVGQGYHYGRPMPPATLEALLKSSAESRSAAA